MLGLFLMPKRKSITGVKRKPKKTAPRAPSSSPNPSSAVPEQRGGSVALGPDVTPGKRTLLSIQNSRRLAQEGYVQKPAHRARAPKPSQPTLKHVSQKTIQSKWKPLDESGQAKAAELFSSIALPVLAQHTNEASKIEAQDAIALVTRNLIKRLPKMPFPPSTKSSHLDYDGLVRSNRDLQQRLKSAVDSVASSNAELEQQRLVLKAERRELRRLEDDLEKQAGQSVYTAPLDPTIKPQDMPDAIGLTSIRAG